MSLNLNPVYNGNDNMFSDYHHNKRNVMATSARAIVYVFKPHAGQLNDVGLRPFAYSFDENFTTHTQELMDLSTRGVASQSAMVSNLMSNVNLSDNMIPSYQAEMIFKGSHLADKYRFILILTETGQGLVTGNTLVNTGNNQVRRIYNGYFTDEPFNPQTFGFGSPTFNPHTAIVITHKTRVGTSVDHGALGPVTKLNTFSSENIVHSQLSNDLSVRTNNNHVDNRIYLMTPENCINSVDVGLDGFSTVSPGAHGDITRDRGCNVVADILEQPTHNVAQIVKGMIKFQDDITHKSRASMYRTDQYYDDTFTDEAFHRNKLGRYMSLPRSNPNSIFDLDIDRPYSLQTIDDMVNGTLEVQQFDIERPIYYETADQTETSMTNQYSFLISSVISPIMNSVGLNEMSFEYSIMLRNGQVQDEFRTYSAAPNWPVPNNDLLSMRKAVEIELVNGIFATIFGSKGDFHVAVSANATGITTVRLSLVGQGYRHSPDFEFPSCLGGLISPLIGTSTTNAHNASQIEDLYSHATGINTSGFNDDDNSFMNHASSMFGDINDFSSNIELD